MSSLPHTYRYAGPSTLALEAGKGLHLVGAGSVADACFFRGTLLYPRVTALCLRAIAEVVLARFYVPPGMLQRILAEADPVVTANRQTLRFEGFSACCSTYARLDVGQSGFSADAMSPGTTNVDFQAPLRAALGRVRGNETLSLSVEAGAVTVDTSHEQVIEKKVPLPLRWIKGLGEVQAHLAGMTETLRTSRAGAMQFLRGLPRNGGRHRAWVVPAGKGLRITQRPAPGSVPLVSPERLRALEPLVPQSSQLRVFTGDAGSSAWVLDLDGQTFSLVVSPERWRGFSGEGQLLGHLASAAAGALVRRVQASLNWQDQIDPDSLAETMQAESDDVRAALSVLAARGLVGFDLDTGSYFHRVLPFDLSAIEALNPRLLAARRLVDVGGIEIRQTSGGVSASVPSTDVVHRVVISEDEATCTCPWYAKHLGKRGPCKHVLAVEIMTEQESA